MSATGSPLSSLSFSKLKLAPISISVVNNPALVSLSVIFGTSISEPSTVIAAQIGNAALDGSLGTRTF